MGEEKVLNTLKVADRLRTLCSRREYCSADIMKKAVAALDGDREEAEKIVAELVRERYVDDRRYAAAFARDKSSIAGWGGTKIRYMLSMKGIPADAVAEALAEIDAGKAQSRLEKLMCNKARSLKEDPQARMKMLRFGMGRGYSYDDVADVTDKILRQWKTSED